eukprot:305049_1
MSTSDTTQSNKLRKSNTEEIGKYVKGLWGNSNIAYLQHPDLNNFRKRIQYQIREETITSIHSSQTNLETIWDKYKKKDHVFNLTVTQINETQFSIHDKR